MTRNRIQNRNQTLRFFYNEIKRRFGSRPKKKKKRRRFGIAVVFEICHDQTKSVFDVVTVF